MNLKFTEESCTVTMNNEAKFDEELTCRFKIGMRNLTNFDPSTQKSKNNFHFKWLLFSKA